MNVKKLTLALAALLSVTTLAACTDSDKKIAFNNYWELDATTSGNVNETLVYDVTFEKGTGLDGLAYALSYGKGSYTTTLKAIENSKQYIYTTELNIPVTYTFGESERATFTDTVKSEVVFYNAANLLRPVSSEKTIVSHTPVSTIASPTKLSECYTAYDYTVSTAYKADNKADATITYRKTEDIEAATEPYSFTYGKGDYSYLDNEQLLLSLRAVPNDTTSGSVKSFDVANDSMRKVKFSFGEETGKKFEVFGKDINYREASLQYSSATPGATQTAKIAALTSAQSNTYRNVILELTTPLSYSLGSLVYDLKSYQF